MQLRDGEKGRNRRVGQREMAAKGHGQRGRETAKSSRDAAHIHRERTPRRPG